MSHQTLDQNIARHKSTSVWFVGLAYLLAVGVSIFLNFIFFGYKAYVPIYQWSNGLVDPTLQANLLNLVLFLPLFWTLGGLANRDLWLTMNSLLAAISLLIAMTLLLQLICFVVATTLGETLAFYSHIVDKPLFPYFGRHFGQLFGNALFEEIFYRGFLLTQTYLLLRRKFPHRRSIIMAILISQSLFAVMHIPNRISHGSYQAWTDILIDQVGVLFAGCVFSVLLLATRNLLVCVVFHAFGNFPPFIFVSESKDVAEFVFHVSMFLLFSAVVGWNWIACANGGKIPIQRWLYVKRRNSQEEIPD